MDWLEIGKLAVSAIGGGAVGSLITQWSGWGVEKLKLKRQTRVQMIENWRQMIATLPQKGGWSVGDPDCAAVLRSPHFISLEHHLDPVLLDRIEKLSDRCGWIRLSSARLKRAGRSTRKGMGVDLMTDEPIRLEMIVGITAAFIDNPSVGPPAIRPTVTLNLVDQSGRIVLLPLSDTVLPQILDILQRLPQTREILKIPGPSEPPTMQ